MELRHLTSFIAVADTHNMTVAAQRCNLTPGAVSHHIIALENEVGAQLFERKAKDMVLTDIGQSFLKRVRNAVNELQDGLDDIVSSKGNLSGELRIGVGSFISPYLRRVAIEFMKRHPNVLLRVNFDNAAVLNKMLRDEELDLAFTMNSAYHHEGITSVPCIPFHLSVIMSKRNKLADKEKVAIEDLMQSKIIMPDCGERVFQTFQKYMKFDLSRLPVSIIIGNAGEALMVLDELDYVTFLPSDYVLTSQKLVGKPIEGLEVELKSNAHYLKHKPLKPSAKAFLDIINELYKQ